MRDDGITESYATQDEPEAQPEPKKRGKRKRYKGGKWEKLHTKLLEWYDQEWRRQSFNRFQMALDEDYYDSLQWTEEDAAELMERGQAPVVYNEIKPTIDWLIGTERRTRIDYKVMPRKREGADDAETKTSLLKYVADVNKAPYARSKAFAKAAKAGLGWIEVGIRNDPTKEPIFYRSQDWRYMLYDSNGTELDLSDARYLFRWKYVDLDVAEAAFPNDKENLRKAATDGDTLGRNENEDELWYMGARVTEPGQDYATASASKYRPFDGTAFAWTRRERVKLMECWYRQPVSVQRVIGGEFDGQRYEPGSDHDMALEAGEATVQQRVELQMRVCIFTEAGILYEDESPYSHGRFPFVPIWGYRRSRDNAPYGPIRAMRDSQDSLNKRGSKALWILSSNRIVMDEGAVDDVEELRDEASRPDAVIIKRQGKQLEIDRDIQLAEEHLRLMDRDQVYIRNGGGVTAENLGRETNATSGKAIIARQDQGSVVTTEIFDNLRLAIQLSGEVELALIEQYYTDEKIIRVTGDRSTPKFVEINKEEDDGVLNDITAFQADFVVAEQDYRDSLRIAMFESLFEIVGRLAQMSPEVALNLLDLVVEMADVPNRDELVQRIRDINGQRDPDEEVTPEQQQVLQAQAQQAAEEEQLAKDLAVERAKAELEEIMAKREKLSADALNSKLEAFYAAIQAAGLVATNPTITPVADDLMTSAGFEDATPESGVAAPAAAPQGMPPPDQGEMATQPPEPASPFEGQRQGIETPENDGMTR